MNVMDALIEVSKQQVKVLSDELKKINVAYFLSIIQTKALKQIKIKQKNISVNIVENNDDDFIITYQDALNIVFEQTIDNAIKFTDKGEIRIGYHIDKNNIEFYIKDSGVGIPVGQEETIFDLFRQAEITYTRKFEGVGIGLFIAKRYTEIMKGKIWADSNEKKGACIKILLPVKIISD